MFIDMSMFGYAGRAVGVAWQARLELVQTGHGNSGSSEDSMAISIAPSS